MWAPLPGVHDNADLLGYRWGRDCCHGDAPPYENCCTVGEGERVIKLQCNSTMYIYNNALTLDGNGVNTGCGIIVGGAGGGAMAWEEKPRCLGAV